MSTEQTAPTIHRTPGTEEDGTPHIVVWVQAPCGRQIGIRVVQDGEELITEEQLVQAETWVKHSLRKHAAGRLADQPPGGPFDSPARNDRPS